MMLHTLARPLALLRTFSRSLLRLALVGVATGTATAVCRHAAAQESSPRVLSAQEQERQAALRDHLTYFDATEAAMPWVGGAVALIGVGMGGWTLHRADYRPDTRRSAELAFWLALGTGGAGAVVLPADYQRPAVMLGAMTANAIGWTFDAALDDAESANRFSSHALATGYSTGVALSALGLLLEPPRRVGLLAAHSRRLSRGPVTPRERARIEADFAQRASSFPCWAQRAPVSVGALAALLPSASSAFGDEHRVPYLGSLMAHIPMTLCLTALLTDPYPSYRALLERMQVAPGVAGRSGLSVSLAF